MSCLSKSHRLTTKNAGGKHLLIKEFNQIYKSNKKWHTHSFIVFFQSSTSLKFAFVASKKVGNAVLRNRAKRLLRALVLKNATKVSHGKYIFVAKAALFERDFSTLEKDFKYAMKKLGLYV